MITHVVWDWNGTLLDDLDQVVGAVNVAVEWMGLPPVSTDTYRERYTRPVQRFYEHLAGRAITEEEWRTIDDLFHDGYMRTLATAKLAAGAVGALDRARGAGVGQSLLSMFPHDTLVPLVEAHGIDPYFVRIDGLPDGSGGRKATYLERHLHAIGLAGDPSQVLMIGDTPDDAAAARHVGAAVILVDAGTHHRSMLEDVGVPVVGSLAEAVAVGVGR